MKIETTDDSGRDIVIDIEPNAEPEAKHLRVTVGHYDSDSGEPTLYEGRLFRGGASDFERTKIGAYGTQTTIGELLNLLEKFAEDNSEAADGVAGLFSGILESALQSGIVRDKGQNALESC